MSRPDAPRVTVSDPRDPRRPADLLGEGDERDPGPRRRWLVGLAALALVVVGVRVGGDVRADRRAAADARRDAAAAFAGADRLHLSVAFSSLGGGDQTLTASVTVVDDGTRSVDRVARLSLRGTGLRLPADAQDGDRVRLPTQTGEFQTTALLDCAAVQRSGPPQDVTVRAVLVPASGVEHLVVLPVRPEPARQAAFAACNLPDPLARTVVEAGATPSGELTLFVDTIDRSETPTVVRAVTVPGFAVSSPYTPLPYRLPSGGGFYGLRVQVQDCAAARRGGLQVSVALDDRRGSATVVAGPQRTQPQPGQVAVVDLLSRLLATSCGADG